MLPRPFPWGLIDAKDWTDVDGGDYFLGGIAGLRFARFRSRHSVILFSILYPRRVVANQSSLELSNIFSSISLNTYRKRLPNINLLIYGFHLRPK